LDAKRRRDASVRAASENPSALQPPIETMSLRRGFFFFRACRDCRLVAAAGLSKPTFPFASMRAKAKLRSVSFSAAIALGMDQLATYATTREGGSEEATAALAMLMKHSA